MKYLLLFCFSFLLSAVGFAQGNSLPDTASSENIKQINAASTRLLESIRDNKGHEEIAANYCSLALKISKTGDYVKAEAYMNKAIAESAGGTGKNTAYYHRELARILEKQNKFAAASASYTKAAELSTDSLDVQLNRNDAVRVQQSSPRLQLSYLNQNAAILSNSTNSYERIENFTSIANTNATLNNNPLALENYREALNTIDSNTLQTIEIRSNMVDLLVASNDLPSAIAMQKELVNETTVFPGVDEQVTQLRNLSALYFKADSVEAGKRALENAYRLSVDGGNLAEAKRSLEELVTFYESRGEQEAAADLYRDFTGKLDGIIARDSTISDRNLFAVTEARITELEHQQSLKDQLLARGDRYNLMLGISVVLLSVLLALIVNAWFSIRKRNKQIALQSLRREMNPHFIFNSLNSVNQFIANSNEREANKYLTSYSNLMRNMMENSNKDYIPLEKEVDQLKKYLELEKLRFPDKFDYVMEVDPQLNPDEVMVPNMIIQPNIENAIWHGLRYKESSGLLKVQFRREENRTTVTIDDNGIGLAESAKIKTRNQKLYESRGLKNVEERVRLLNEIYKSGIRFDIRDKPMGGVTVTIAW